MIAQRQDMTVGTFATHRDAERAVNRLIESGVQAEHLSIVTQQLEEREQVHGFVTAGDVAKTGATTGAWFGGLLGLFTGAALLWVPGMGQVIFAGWLTATVVTALEGGAVGGLIGAVFGHWANTRHVLKYEESLKGGKLLVVVHGDAAESELAQRILSAEQGQDVTIHTFAP